MTRHRNRRGAIGPGMSDPGMRWGDYVRLSQIFFLLGLILATPTIAAFIETGQPPRLPF